MKLVEFLCNKALTEVCTSCKVGFDAQFHMELKSVFMGYSHKIRTHLSKVLKFDIRNGCQGFADAIFDASCLDGEPERLLDW